MSFQDLLLYLDSLAASDARIEAAVSLARRFGCSVTGVYAEFLPDPAEPIAGEARALATTVSERFTGAARREGIVATWHTSDEGYPDGMEVLARHADLAIVGQTRPDFAAEFVSPEEIVLTSGHPTLVVPYAGTVATVGERHVLIAWNGGREAARAVFDAMPFLHDARAVTVIGIDLDDAGRRSMDAVSAYLTRHGVRAILEPATALDLSPGEVLLARAVDTASDLIVMGAYGHSRLREWVLGGVTRHVLDHMTVPALISH